jgi:hypothetical protein
MRLKKQFSVILLVLAILTACKTQVLDLQQHPSFTYEAATSSVFIAAGVVSGSKKLNTIHRIQYGDLLARKFNNTRHHLQVIRTGYMVKKIGVDPFEHLLDGYRLTGVIMGRDTVDIQNAFPQARYLILSRIEKNHISQSHVESKTDVADSTEDQGKKEYEHVRIDISLDSKRDVEASLMIYDMQQDFTVWSGYVRKSKTNSNRSSRTYNKDNRWKEELANFFVDTLIGLNNDGYPELPLETEVLEEVFEGFAENMPEPPKR